MSDSARSVAAEVVRRVADGDAFSNLLLPSPIDRALAGLVRRPLERASAPARAALRLGAYQLLHTRIPAHAAVTETVSLVPLRQRGFVNAVLRRLTADRPEPPSGADDAAIAVRT